MISAVGSPDATKTIRSGEERGFMSIQRFSGDGPVEKNKIHSNYLVRFLWK